MKTPILKSKGFAEAVIDALASQICVVDQDGVIVTVNLAWQNFAVENPPITNRSGVGSHYLNICRDASGEGSEEARNFALGIQAVLDGTANKFEIEYPCHSPNENRWFLARVTPLNTVQRGAVISHMTITDRKLLELELVRLAATDPLTGAPNRRFFMDAGDQEVERVRRFGTAASVVMIDIDHFKAVNDSHGHSVGDEALRSIVPACLKLLRRVDVFARIGGEEFAVLLPGTDEAGASIVAEKLRHAISEAPFSDTNDHLRITASFGAAQVSSGDRTVDEALGRADLALYAAKRSGRNCVVSFGATPQMAET